MAVPIATGATVSVTANLKSPDQVSGQFERIGKGKVTLVILTSAIGINVTLNVGGISIIDDLPCPQFGTTGGLDVSAHVMASQLVDGGKVELFLRNTTGGTLTNDFNLLFEPA